MKSVDEQLELISRAVEQIEPKDGLRTKLESSAKTGRPLRVKYGIDPTGIDVHLGHTVPLRKLRLFQDLGHKAILILGNYTALVGDPSGRDETRAGLTEEQVEANAKDYLRQINKIVNVDDAEVRFNGEWFSKFRFLDTLSLMRRITMQRMLERDDFTKRLKKDKPIYLHECLYPLMQGHDSVEIKADIELGGSEQLFSLMVGRDLQRDAGQEPQVCITLPILRGLDGQKRMGKSLKNYIGVGEPAYDMFAKAMSIPDDLMREWFELLTERPIAEIARLVDAQATHPREAKETLGKDIVRFYHGEAEANAAAVEWRKRFSERQDPTEIPEKDIAWSELKDGCMNVCDLLVRVELAPSKNEARRLVGQGAVTRGPDRVKVTDPHAAVEISDGLIVRAGKLRIARVRLKR